MQLTLKRNWWTFLVRGILAMLFALAIYYITMPANFSSPPLALSFLIYILSDGIFASIGAVRGAERTERWTLFLLPGAINIATFTIAGLWPMGRLFLTVVPVWALIAGAGTLITAFKLDAAHGRWWLCAAAGTMIFYGARVLLAPSLGMNAPLSTLSFFEVMFGIALLGVAERLRVQQKAV